MNKIGRIICCAVLCVPLVVAIVIGIMSGADSSNYRPDQTTNNVNRFVKVRIQAEDGTLINEYESEDVLTDYFNAINGRDEITDYLVDDSSTTFLVTLVGTQSDVTYKFIMSSEKIGNCVYKDIDERIYAFPSDVAKELLMRDEFASANKYEGVVNLKMSYSRDSEIFNQLIAADVYSWKYTRLDGEIITKVNDEESSELETIVLPQNTIFDLSFDSEIAPDTVDVTVTDGAETIYKGEPGALPTYLTFTKDTLINVSVDAKWLESDKSVYYGDVKYNFNIMYDFPSQFKLVDTKLSAGEFTVINVIDGIPTSGVVKAESEILSGAMESFVHNGVRRIYIPIKPNVAPGVYQIKLTEFSGVSTIDFTVTPKSFSTHENVLVSPDVAELATSVNVAEFEDVLGQYRSTNTPEQYWKDKFILPVENGTVVCSFGDTLNIPANTKVSDGMYITGAEGGAVRAANDGTILYVGETKYSGHTVIIDHGLGILSYYFNLGGTSCTQGDRITKGSTIGTIGTSGYTPFSNTVTYCNSVGGSFINPKTQIDYSINLG